MCIDTIEKRAQWLKPMEIYDCDDIESNSSAPGEFRFKLAICVTITCYLQYSKTGSSLESLIVFYGKDTIQAKGNSL